MKNFTRRNMMETMGSPRVRNAMFGSQKCLAVLIALIGVCTISAKTLKAAAITQDLLVDSTSVFNGQHISVADGMSGPTTVRVVTGGNVNGFNVSGNSRLILDGGIVSYLSRISGNAQFIYRSGTLDCLSSECVNIDYIALLIADDESEVHIYGGANGDVLLRDTSTAHVYGQNLVLNSMPGQFQVAGTFTNGFEISLLIQGDASQIFLHEIPEPSSIALALIGAILIAALWQYRLHQVE